ncbi:hypothetical protein DTO013E5_2447 [Penicillium roqueforti]|uniref:uncharacterized protein n=1 Tax=Penicillium roqueforti TaxID=5082 RepID=UPI00190BCA9F|nr:uncharacterized protein LCP9604111_881 [Penicillium roqueforti]KAF9253355.1 hypothetical protein LCP9604111_881 [Penicillium roqueforti]KAI1838394.1 hypothetical protein CBS147337_119 [Penicillium roqueforti]KAI2680680.1 hypothetical protein CBS147355_3660 [Penicillium roqueforti]KAI2690931.1 hypothetical protein LCP963914a_1132 [Penicillium roqueforti]KAI2707112.1 hypothetical protein CBS147372_1023 [Penicillium roqueforti]
MYHYSSPPPGWSTYDYTQTQSPPTSPQYAYYASQFANAYTSPRGTSRRHNRKASYSTTKETPWYSSGHPQGYYEATPDYGIPSRKHDHVSASFAGKPKHHRYSSTGHPTGDGLGNGYHPSQSQARPIFVDVVDEAFDVPRTHVREPRTGRRPPASNPTRDGPGQHRRTTSTSYRKSNPADSHFYFTQAPNGEDIDAARRSHTRRQSTSTRTPNKPKPPPASAKPPPTATEDDAEAAGIPPGYSIKNWDPTEAPIILLGSVFDANSLGKWIYDWTVFYHGASTPMADVAGDLWLLLIKLAGKVKRADECLPRIHRVEAQEVVEDFLESGERLWSRFKKLLKGCELYMWKAAKREGGKGPVSMGRNAGCEFVESIFGRDRELESTEKLMNSIRLWNMRFDANCEDILRRPSAA